MALASRLFQLPDETGNAVEDLRQLRKAIHDHFVDLQRRGSLAISTIQYWTPTLTFATVGNLSVVYSARVGEYVLTERELRVCFRIVTSTFTHTTAAGNLQVTGLPIISSAETRDANLIWDGSLVWSGVTFAGAHTQMNCSVVANSSTIIFTKCGTAVLRLT